MTQPMLRHLAQDAPSDFAGKKAGACMVRPRAVAGGGCKPA